MLRIALETELCNGTILTASNKAKPPFGLWERVDANAKPAGWGGPAKGAGHGGPAAPFTRDSPTRVTHPGPAWPRSQRREMVAQRSLELEDMLYGLALESEDDKIRVVAAKTLYEIYNGAPVARNVNVNTDDISALTDDELRSQLADLNRETLAH